MCITKNRKQHPIIIQSLTEKKLYFWPSTNFKEQFDSLPRTCYFKTSSPCTASFNFKTFVYERGYNGHSWSSHRFNFQSSHVMTATTVQDYVFTAISCLVCLSLGNKQLITECFTSVAFLEYISKCSVVKNTSSGYRTEN